MRRTVALSIARWKTGEPLRPEEGILGIACAVFVDGKLTAMFSKGVKGAASRALKCDVRAGNVANAEWAEMMLNKAQTCQRLVCYDLAGFLVGTLRLSSWENVDFVADDPADWGEIRRDLQVALRHDGLRLGRVRPTYGDIETNDGRSPKEVMAALGIQEPKMEKEAYLEAVGRAQESGECREGTLDEMPLWRALKVGKTYEAIRESEYWKLREALAAPERSIAKGSRTEWFWKAMQEEVYQWED